MSSRLRSLLLVGSSAICLFAIPATAQAASKWAVVNSVGTLVRSNGATAAASLSTGTYQVTFKTSMLGCAFIATPGDTGTGAVPAPSSPPWQSAPATARPCMSRPTIRQRVPSPRRRSTSPRIAASD